MMPSLHSHFFGKIILIKLLIFHVTFKKLNIAKKFKRKIFDLFSQDTSANSFPSNINYFCIIAKYIFEKV